VKDEAALARNWRTILAIDVGMGVIVLAAGVVLLLAGSWWGLLIASVGLIQTFFAIGRVTKWRRIRRRAGLGRTAP
jgi:hypothetical protein